MRRLAVLLAAVLLAAWLALAPSAAEPPADAFVEAQKSGLVEPITMEVMPDFYKR